MKQQHLERTTDFLVEELRCVSKKDATDRVFFVSALEVFRFCLIFYFKISHFHCQACKLLISSLLFSTSIQSTLYSNVHIYSILIPCVPSILKSPIKRMKLQHCDFFTSFVLFANYRLYVIV